MTRRRHSSHQKKIRFLDDGLILENGERWDRVRPSGNYFSTAREVSKLAPIRVVRIIGRSTPVDLSREEYAEYVALGLAEESASGEARVGFIVYSRGGHDVIVGVVPEQDWF